MDRGIKTVSRDDVMDLSYLVIIMLKYAGVNSVNKICGKCIDIDSRRHRNSCVECIQTKN